MTLGSSHQWDSQAKVHMDWVSSLLLTFPHSLMIIFVSYAFLIRICCPKISPASGTILHCPGQADFLLVFPNSFKNLQTQSFLERADYL